VATDDEPAKAVFQLGDYGNPVIDRCAIEEVGTYTSKKAERQAEAGRRRTADEAAWEGQHRGMRRPDPAEFAPIALGLQRFTASEIARHLGVSVSIASKYRRGLAVPHVRHWAALAELGGVTASSG
jgi:hypothetical protein